MTFCEAQVRYLLSLKQRNVHIDATASLVAVPSIINLHSQTIYLYSFIVPGGDGFGPISVCDILLGSHDSVTIGGLYRYFGSMLKKVSATKKLHKMETDFSLALLHALTWGFNHMTLHQCIQTLYDIYERGIGLEDGLVIVHICSSHLIKTVLNKAEKCFPNKRTQGHERRVVGAFMNKLIHCDSVASAAKIYESLVKVFGFEKEPENLDEILKDLENNADHNIDINVDDDLDHETVDDGGVPELGSTSAKTQEKSAAVTKNSPYCEVFKSVETKVLSNRKCTETNNRFCSENFMKYMTDFLMPYFPLWSAINIIQVGLFRDSNAPIENYFRILKYLVFKTEKKLTVPRFIMRYFEFIKASLKERKFSLETTRQVKRRAKDDDNPSEVWKRRNTERTHVNRHLTHDKFVGSPEKIPAEILKLAAASEGLDSFKDFEAQVGSPCTTSCESPSKISETTMLEEEYATESEMVDDELTEIEDSENLEADMMSSPDTVNCEIDCVNVSRQGSSGLSSTTFDEPPWRNIENYPEKWRDTNFYIDGMLITEHCLKTLLPDEYVDDNIINAFMKIINANTQGDNKPLVFDVHFFYSLMASDGRVGFMNWANRVKAFTYAIWLLPLCQGKHWTLFVIVFPHKCIVYIDSLRKTPGSDIVQRLCAFIEKLHMRKDTPKLDLAE